MNKIIFKSITAILFVGLFIMKWFILLPIFIVIGFLRNGINFFRFEFISLIEKSYTLNGYFKGYTYTDHIQAKDFLISYMNIGIFGNKTSQIYLKSLYKYYYWDRPDLLREIIFTSFKDFMVNDFKKIYWGHEEDYSGDNGYAESRKPVALNFLKIEEYIDKGREELKQKLYNDDKFFVEYLTNNYLFLNNHFKFDCSFNRLIKLCEESFIKIDIINNILEYNDSKIIARIIRYNHHLLT